MVDFLPLIAIAGGVCWGRLMRRLGWRFQRLEAVTTWVFYGLLICQGSLLPESLANEAMVSRAIGAVLAGILVLAITLLLGFAAESLARGNRRFQPCSTSWTKIGAVCLRILTFIAVGAALGRMDSLGVARLAVSWVLYLMLFLVGVGLGVAEYRYDLRRAFKAGFAAALLAITGSVLGGAVASSFLGKSAILASLGCGWYSYAGPFLTVASGVDAGLVGLFLNLSRECVVLLLLPVLARALGARTLSAACGAGAMDSLLPMIARSSTPDAVAVSIVSGLIVTVLVPPMLVLGAMLMGRG